MRLFGTDGIRGKVVADGESDDDAINSLFTMRTICPRLFRLIGEALGATLAKGDEVVIGWDLRPDNSGLVEAITQGFHLRGISVIWVGDVATPALQACLLERGAKIGCMVTASHNPVADSGVKIFDSHGYKSMPPFEDQVSDIVAQLAAEEREIDTPELKRISQPDGRMDGRLIHRQVLEKRLVLFTENLAKNSSTHAPSIPPEGIALDTSGGSAQEWLVEWLINNGINVFSVGNPTGLNVDCGAGDFSPNDNWSWDELSSYSGQHALLIHLSEYCQNGRPEHWDEGFVVGAALDGDGDRCLLIVVVEGGLAIFDGDMMADAILRSGGAGWQLAASIETDLGLMVDFQTAVGDRWLSAALGKSFSAPRGFLHDETMPKIVGSEDSGHLVLPSPHPTLTGHWSLVGDGVATLLAVLSADRGLGGICLGGFTRGWKRRISIKGVERSRWDGENSLSDMVEDLARDSVMNWGECQDWRRTAIAGETSLLLLEATLNGQPVSIGIRNSGTEAKTNVSIRMAPEISMLSNLAQQLLEAIEEVLKRELID